jgi:hypothetical protein
MVAKSLSTSQRYAQLSTIAGALAEFCQAMFPLLVAHTDDFGRLAGDPFTVKHKVVPTSPRPESDVAQALAFLDAVHLIQWYEVEGRKWVQVEQFDAHQQGLHKRTQSSIPEPPNGSSREIPGNSRSRARAELKGREGKRSTRKNAAAPPTHTRQQKELPNVAVLASMVLKEILPLRLGIADQAEAAKCRAASLHLAYDSRAIANALASAQAQAAKLGVRYDS